MMNVFRRYEKKYLITQEQAAVICDVMSKHIMPDRFNEYIVQNLYFDTANWESVRASIEKPIYKDKLRLRCYGELQSDDDVFLELKKKHKSVVYKRRIAVSAHDFQSNSVREIASKDTSQIAHELKFFLDVHPVFERMLVSYKRTAFAGIEDRGLRVTFDEDVRYRQNNLGFSQPRDGNTILPGGIVVMEIKTHGAMPLELTRLFSEMGVFPVSFSKYGTCYIRSLERMVRKSA